MERMLRSKIRGKVENVRTTIAENFHALSDEAKLLVRRKGIQCVAVAMLGIAITIGSGSHADLANGQTMPNSTSQSEIFMPQVMAEAPVHSSIVGGQNADVGEHPEVAIVQVENNGEFFQCDGTLIHKDWVLTAGHCTPDGTPTYSVFLGVYNADEKTTDPHVQTFITTEGYRHPSYNTVGSNIINDAGLIHLSTSAVLNDYVSTIQLPSASFIENAVSSTLLAETVGFGVVDLDFNLPNPYIKQEVDVPLVTLAQCQEWYTGTSFTITDGQICAGYEAGGKDSCYGDSGGPLKVFANYAVGGDVVVGWVQLGIISNGDQCALPMKPGIYDNLNNDVGPDGFICQQTNGQVGCVTASLPPTVTETATPTITPTETPTPTPTSTNTKKPTRTPTATNTPIPTETLTGTPTPTETDTPTATSLATSTETETPTSTQTATNTPTSTETSTTTDTATPSSTPIPSEMPTPSETPTPTYTIVVFTRTPTPTVTPTPTIHSIKETITPTVTPTIRPSQTPMPTSTPSATATHTLTPTATKQAIEVESKLYLPLVAN